MGQGPPKKENGGLTAKEIEGLSELIKAEFQKEDSASEAARAGSPDAHSEITPSAAEAAST